mgnify:CR=1 FL=1
MPRPASRSLIVDEIHALLPAKRGSHLALSLERLDALTGHRATRVGLSATQKPIEDAARFLVGTARVDAEGRADCRIVDVGADVGEVLVTVADAMVWAASGGATKGHDHIAPLDLLLQQPFHADCKLRPALGALARRQRT